MNPDQNFSNDVIEAQPPIDQAHAGGSASGLSESPYNPDFLLDTIKEHLDVKNDAGLARRLEFNVTAISKLRHRITQVPASLYISMHEETKISIADLKLLAGDTRKHLGRYGVARGRRSTKAKQ